MAEDHFLNLQPGTIVNGRYEIVKCLGTGSMGMVYACRHRELSGHLVAMKVLFSEVARDEVAAARFRNEIVASYGVNHPNVVRAYEYFRDGDLVAFTMEYVGGGDLADRIGSDVGIDIDDTIKLLIQMCSGVQAIHDAGIIHRDLKPENILLTAQGDIKITDFGIARTGTGPKLTEYGGVVGTIDYVSPEYLERGQVDARSDIYSLGVLAYEMITGESPFKGKSVIETMTMRLRSDPEAPHTVRADCPESLSRVVLMSLSRVPESRYQSASEMMQDLIAISGGNHNVALGVLEQLTRQPSVEEEAVEVNHRRGSGSLVVSKRHEELDEHDDDGQSYQDKIREVLSHPSEALTDDLLSDPFIQDDDDLKGTVMLNPEQVSQFKSEALPEEMADPPRPTSDSPPRSSPAIVSPPNYPRSSRGDFSNSNIHPVTVSQGRISADRLKEISAGMHRNKSGSTLLKDIMLGFAVIVVGLAVGYLFFQRYVNGQSFGYQLPF